MNQQELEQAQNEDYHKLEILKLRHIWTKTAEGGGKKRIEKLHAEGKMTARERIDFLRDKDTDFLEIGAFVGHELYEEHGGCPSGGVVGGIGYIQGRLVMMIANDATVKAGAWFPLTGKKNIRLQEIAIENRLPVVYLVDSAGVFLPMQDEIFPDKEHFGRMFRNNAKMSAMGVPQISAIMGACVAGGAYLPAMSDESLIVERTGSIFLAGPHLVKAAIGETVDKETLGGATTQSEISGVTDYKMPDDATCLQTIRQLVDKFGESPKAGFDRIAPVAPLKDPQEIYKIFPADRSRPYNMVEVLERLVDNSELVQYKEGYGKTLICAYARIDGWAVGIVANNRQVTKSKKGEVQFGGVIYSDSADKAARFVMNCNQRKIPLLFLHDVTGFMVGTRSEHGGIIKDGAKLVMAMANSTVPKITIVMGNSYGAGNYALCGRAFDPRFMFGWYAAKIAVMGGAQAAQVLLATQKDKTAAPDPEADKEMLAKITQKYDSQTTPYYAAARLWIDGIIDPLDTRKVVSMSIASANNAPVEKYMPGILQT
jgi:acetyl-CoA carboxylase carboxyltransferase component